MACNHPKPEIHIAWTTITYRTVVLLVLAFAAVVFISMRVASLQFRQNTLQKSGDVTGRVLEKVAGMAPATRSAVVTVQQAHFTALNGTVCVKKGNGKIWVAADDHIRLEKG